MPRKKREKSPWGIYHVMLRGINKQNIFFQDDDFKRILMILRDIQLKKDHTGQILSDDVCTIYAYCVLNNHLHILIKEGTLSISEIMKKIEDRYAVYYNLKYQRVGHLFQGRFPSEAVCDELYFRTVFRYITQNPVKALECTRAEQYPYSSWNEYVGDRSNVLPVLKANTKMAILEKYSLEALKRWVYDTGWQADVCLDMDSFRNVISDAEACEIVLEISGEEDIESFKLLDFQTQIYWLLECVKHGVTLRQASRLSSITFYQLQHAQEKKCVDTPIKGSDPLIGNLHSLEGYKERVRSMSGIGKQTRGRLYKIVEFLYDIPSAKRNAVAEMLDINVECARRNLVLLVNENIVEVVGNARSRTYRLKA